MGLRHLQIRNLAIVDELELEIQPGMTALTGETGAGKSILIDALGLVLGDRADTQAIRAGAQRAEITAEFDLSGLDTVAAWLADNDFDAEGDCILRRVVGSDGRSKGYINGRSSPMGTLRELGEQLVDIHGQHEHQSLLRRDAQRGLLDHFGEHGDCVEAVRQAHADWQAARDRLTRLGGDPAERVERLDLLRYQVQELDTLALAEGEIDALDAEHRRLANAGELIETGQRSVMRLYDDDISVHGLLSQVATDLERLGEHDARLQAASEMVAHALIQCDEAVTSVRDYIDATDLDPARLEEVEQRLSAVHDLARKHRVEPAELPAHAERLRGELDELEHADERAADAEREIAEREQTYRGAASTLHDARAAAATRLGQQVTEAMQGLGMAGGSFQVAVETRADERFSSAGLDEIEFRVTANPGQPPAPLRRVASGGELSRISLAIQMIGSRRAGVPTQIFDEVDAGIGGAVAATVGDHLRELGEYYQVLCVTHLAQVAARGHQHLQVAKAASAEETQTRVAPLDEGERVEEIARMLGGREITDQSRAHAREMLAGG
ncbi:MAG: DNA repair protein RecN [Halofilum sp. (in: g-proteobacteria)]